MQIAICITFGFWKEVWRLSAHQRKLPPYFPWNWVSAAELPSFSTLSNTLAIPPSSASLCGHSPVAQQAYCLWLLCPCKSIRPLPDDSCHRLLLRHSHSVVCLQCWFSHLWTSSLICAYCCWCHSRECLRSLLRMSNWLQPFFARNTLTAHRFSLR